MCAVFPSSPSLARLNLYIYINVWYQFSPRAENARLASFLARGSGLKIDPNEAITFLHRRVLQSSGDSCQQRVTFHTSPSDRFRTRSHVERCGCMYGLANTHHNNNNNNNQCQQQIRGKETAAFEIGLGTPNRCAGKTRGNVNVFT